MKARNAHLIIYKLDTSNQLCLQTLQLLFIRKWRQFIKKKKKEKEKEEENDGC